MAHRVLDEARQHRGARDVFDVVYLHPSLTTDTQKLKRVEYVVKQILQKELALDIETRRRQEEEPNTEYTADGLLGRGGFFIAFRPEDPDCAEIDLFYSRPGVFAHRGSFRLCQGEGSTGRLYYKPPPPPEYDDQPVWLVWEDMYADDDEVDTPPVRSRAASGDMGGRRRRRTRRRKGSRGKNII